MARYKNVFEGVTTAQEYGNFLLSGNSLASTGKVGDANVRSITNKYSNWNSAVTQAKNDLKAGAVDQVEGAQTYNTGTNQIQMVKPEEEQVSLLTNLFQQRLSNIMARRARPGFQQVS